MIRFLRLILCRRFGKLLLLPIAVFVFLAFFAFDNLQDNSVLKTRDDSKILEHLVQRLDKLERSLSELQSSKQQENNHKQENVLVNQPRLSQRNECAIPSNWRFPFCRDKVMWMQQMWRSNPDCYFKKHLINIADDCSILRFLSEAEAWCPVLPGREKPNPLLSRPKANLRTNISGLMELFKPDYYAWLRSRVNHYWPYWVEGLQLLKKRKTNLDNRHSQKILIFLGSFAYEPEFFKYAFKGGPLGELVQWTDTIVTLYILGHNITLSSKKEDLPRLLNIPKDKGCASRTSDDDFDIIYSDYNGLKYIAMTVGPNHSQYRCKLRVLDSFGTEAEYNFLEYPHPIPGGLSPWAMADINLRQIMTMFPHSPDDTFLGFVVDGPPKSLPHDIKKANGKPIGLVYGKEARFWKGKREYLDLLHEYFELHATIGDYGLQTEASNVPKYIVNHGLLKRSDLQKLLEKAKVFIGLGFPYEGPAPLEAIARGCIFLNAKLDPPQSKLNNHFFKQKPTLRALTSQHPYTEDFIGEPYVFTVDISNKTAVRIAAEKILKTQVQPYLPLEWTPEGMLERVNSFTENLDFCTKDSKIWPPESQNQLIKGQIGVSCKDVCMKKGLICESMHFHMINTEDTFKKLEIDCQTYKKETVLDAPSYEPKNMSCTLQNHPLAFSCVAKNPSQVRLCPCRDFQSQQVALCKKCS